MAQPMSHAILRWHAKFALLDRERAHARERLDVAATDAARVAAEEQLRLIEQKIRAMGPDPSAKMG